MAFKLNAGIAKMGEVEIDGKTYTPKVTVEKRLRLAKALSGDGLSTEALDLMAECFGENAAEIREKLNNFSVTGVCELQVYLMNGEVGVEDFRNSTNNKKTGAEGVA